MTNNVDKPLAKLVKEEATDKKKQHQEWERKEHIIKDTIDLQRQK